MCVCVCRVEERFREMAEKEPLLRMAISRGLTLDLKPTNEQEQLPTTTTANTTTTSTGATDNDSAANPSGESMCVYTVTIYVLSVH